LKYHAGLQNDAASSNGVIDPVQFAAGGLQAPNAPGTFDNFLPPFGTVSYNAGSGHSLNADAGADWRFAPHAAHSPAVTVNAVQTTCNVQFDVTSNVVGAPLNRIAAGAITSTSGIVNTQTAKASLTVNAGLGIQKTFVSPTLPIGGTDYVRFLITNSASTSVLSAGTLLDAMPSSLTLASTTLGPAQGGDPALCGGGLSGTVGSSTFTLTGLTVAGSTGASTPGQCVAYASIKASAGASPGSAVNTVATGALTVGGFSNQTSAAGTVTLTAPPSPSVAKSFSPAVILTGGTSVLTVSIANTASGAAALSALALTDTCRPT
jgi:hypothetical protein